METKEFMIGNHNFVINYLVDESLLNLFNTNDYKAIVVRLLIDQSLSESDAKKIVYDNSDAILLEFKKVMDEYPDVYKHFIYNNSLSTGFITPAQKNPELNVLEIDIQLKKV